MIVTVLKTTFKKAKPKEIIYRYKYLDKNKFRDDLRRKLGTSSYNCGNYSNFETDVFGSSECTSPFKKRRLYAQTKFLT